MDKSQFALSLGFAGVILATYAGWGGAPAPMTNAAAWPFAVLAHPLR